LVVGVVGGFFGWGLFCRVDYVGEGILGCVGLGLGGGGGRGVVGFDGWVWDWLCGDVFGGFGVGVVFWGASFWGVCIGVELFGCRWVFLVCA